MSDRSGKCGTKVDKFEDVSLRVANRPHLLEVGVE